MLSAFTTRDYTSSMTQPSKIHGRPTFLQLRKLEQQLIANAANIQCELGGGSHGYLGLLKSPEKYAIIAPDTPFVMPASPGQLVLPNNTTGHESFRLQQNHIIAVDKYKEAREVRKALGLMLKNAIDHEYVTEFLDSDTYLINQPLYDVLESLYAQYGQVRRQDLKTMERDVENMSYDLTQPLSVVWKAIDNLKKLAIAARIEYSDDQLVHLGLAIIQSTHDFEKAQEEWLDKPTAYKTYTNLRQHFNTAHKKLQQIRGEDMMPAAQHHANAMRLNLRSDNVSIQEDLISNVSSIKQDTIDAILENKENLQPIEESANAATVDAMTKLTNAIAGLEKRVQQVETTALQTRSQNTFDPQYNIAPWLRPGNTFLYCWTCGSNSTHSGTNCNRKREGHKDDATFQDRKGGSVRRIPKRFRSA